MLSGVNALYPDEILPLMAAKAPVSTVKHYVRIMKAMAEENKSALVTAEAWSGICSQFLSTALVMNPSIEVMSYLLEEKAELSMKAKQIFSRADKTSRSLQEAGYSCCKVLLREPGIDYKALIRFLPEGYSSEVIDFIFDRLLGAEDSKQMASATTSVDKRGVGYQKTLYNFHKNYPNISKEDFAEFYQLLSKESSVAFEDLVILLQIKAPVQVIKRCIEIVKKPEGVDASKILDYLLVYTVLMHPSLELMQYLLEQKASLPEEVKKAVAQAERSSEGLKSVGASFLKQFFTKDDPFRPWAEYLPKKYRDEEVACIFDRILK